MNADERCCCHKFSFANCNYLVVNFPDNSLADFGLDIRDPSG
jgi:hypothetical protein